MTDFLDKIYPLKTGKRVLDTRFADLAIDSTIEEVPMSVEHDIVWNVGVTASLTMFGPSSEASQMTTRARRCIAKEIYGDLYDDCMLLERILHEETYRAPGDPAVTFLRSIMEKMQ